MSLCFKKNVGFIQAKIEKVCYSKATGIPQRAAPRCSIFHNNHPECGNLPDLFALVFSFFIISIKAAVC